MFLQVFIRYLSNQLLQFLFFLPPARLRLFLFLYFTLLISALVRLHPRPQSIPPFLLFPLLLQAHFHIIDTRFDG